MNKKSDFKYIEIAFFLFYKLEKISPNASIAVPIDLMYPEHLK